MNQTEEYTYTWKGATLILAGKCYVERRYAYALILAGKFYEPNRRRICHRLCFQLIVV